MCAPGESNERTKQSKTREVERRIERRMSLEIFGSLKGLRKEERYIYIIYKHKYDMYVKLYYTW